MLLILASLKSGCWFLPHSGKDLGMGEYHAELRLRFGPSRRLRNPAPGGSPRASASGAPERLSGFALGRHEIGAEVADFARGERAQIRPRTPTTPPFENDLPGGRERDARQ